jgi:hypothetical protein
MLAYWRLPESLQITAYSAGGEYAWPRDQALLVIQNLSENGFAVIGAEVWLATDPGPTIPTPGIYTWEAQSRHAAEQWSAFARRVNNEAADFVSAFSWHPDDRKRTSDVPYFNLTVIEERDL